MDNEPIKHHYIPQFILRNFTFDGIHLFFQNATNHRVCVKDTKDVFMTRNLYRDEINNPDNPTKLEKEFAEYEREVSTIIRKLVNDNDITLTVQEDESLKLFLAILGFRSDRVKKAFGEEAKKENIEYYSKFQVNDNLTDFWKKNLNALVKCRSIKEVVDNAEVSKPIKAFMKRDTQGLFGRYLVVAERRGNLDFIISENYPVVFRGVDDKGLALDIYSAFPLSPDRVLLLVSRGAVGAPESVRVLSKEILKQPKLAQNGKQMTIHVKKIYEKEVEYINSSIKENSSIGWVFKDKTRRSTYDQEE